MNSAISALKKAHQAQAITKDTYSLEKFFNKFEENDTAVLDIVAAEVKYVSQYDKRHVTEGEGAGSLGMRTRFFLRTGETVGAFSNAAFRFFAFLAQPLGYKNVEDMDFLHIDITGNVKIAVTVIALDAKRKTYNFDIIEEGSDFEGLSDYNPMGNTLLLAAPENVDTKTGEIKEPQQDEPAQEPTEVKDEPKAEEPKAGRTKK